MAILIMFALGYALAKLIKLIILLVRAAIIYYQANYTEKGINPKYFQ